MHMRGVLAGLLLTVGLSCAQTLANRIDKILAKAHPAAWGVRVVDMKSGVVVCARNPNQPFVPASNTKLFSTALALTRLGPEYRFRTTITAPASPDSAGRVAGLRFVGGGDPNLSGRVIPYQYDSPWGNPTQQVEAFAQQLVDAGVRWVDGDIVGDDSAYAYEPFPEGWAVDDPIYDYGAPVSALFLNDSTFSVKVNGAVQGEPPSVETNPKLQNIVIHNRALTNASSDLKFARLPGSNELTITGTTLGDREFRFAVDDPALFAAEALRDALAKRGVRISGVARSEHTAAPGVPLVTYESQPLIEALKVINKESVNLHAEIVLLETGRVRTGVGSRKSALEDMAAFLDEIGIPKTEYTFEDGSGLSRKTLLTPFAITQLLVHMYGSPHREKWVDTLPVGGQDGTLAKRFGANLRARRIHAKTGSLSHVNALSGYAGDRYAFSILVNNANVPASDVRKVIDQIALTLTPNPVRIETQRVPKAGRVQARSGN